MRNTYLMQKLRNKYQGSLGLEVVQTMSHDERARLGVKLAKLVFTAFQLTAKIYQGLCRRKRLACAFENLPR